MRGALVAKVAILLMLAPGLAGCDSSSDGQRSALEQHVVKNREGTSPDVWLVKLNALGVWEKTALIFGYMDDANFCIEIAELYAGRYPAERYSCLLAN